jgi:YbbR domain-containing protein
LKVGELSTQPEKVEITTGETTMKEIDRVVASVDSSKLSSDQESIQAPVQALNASGEVLPIQSDPQNVTVNFEIQTPSKEVSLYPIQEGDLPSSVESVKIDLNRTKATITGVQSVIDQIDSIGIPVDVSQIQGTVKKFIDVPISGNYQVIPKTVSAQVTPVFKKSQDSETSSTNHSSSSTTGAAGNSSDSSRSSETSTDTHVTSSQEESTNQSAN